MAVPAAAGGSGSAEMENYTEEELEEYREVFSVFDTDGSGAIGTDELGEVASLFSPSILSHPCPVRPQAMKSLGMATSDSELSALIQEVDADGNGEIGKGPGFHPSGFKAAFLADFEEFCACMKQMSDKKESEEEVIRSCFKVCSSFYFQYQVYQVCHSFLG